MTTTAETAKEALVISRDLFDKASKEVEEDVSENGRRALHFMREAYAAVEKYAEAISQNL